MEAAAHATKRLPELAKYEILEEIGRGGMATVYRARDRRLGREVALKVIHPHLRDSTEVAARFYVEAKAVAKLRHPNIVEVFDVSGAEEQEQYLVAELVRGTTLRGLLRQHGPMPPEVAAAVALELLDALAHANASGVIHRDIKPENVLIAHKPAPIADADIPGTVRVAVKLTDFGIAKLLDAQGVTSTGQVLGSPAHMSPEQIDGGDVDVRSDVFGLGVLLYECMVGHLPFEGNNPAQVLRRVLEGEYPPAHLERAAVGSRWSALLDRALARSPADRFSDALAMREAAVRELTRLGFDASTQQLASWLDDPAVYSSAYQPRMVQRLCACGDEARRRGDAVAAASDYNRALAYAPDDPQLMRIVAGLSRAEARGRATRWIAMVMGGMAAIAASTIGIGLGVRRHVSPPSAAASVIGPEPVRDRLSHTAPVISEPRIPPADPGPTAGIIPTATLVPDPPHSAVHEKASPRTIERTLTLALRPPMGVVVSIDGQALRPVSTGDSLTLDGGAHLLSFSCSVCTPLRLAIEAGDKSDTLEVSVAIKPAILLVEGSVDRTYQVTEHPELSVRAGVNSITLSSAYEHITVKQIETGVEVPVRLEAGTTKRATFQ